MCTKQEEPSPAKTSMGTSSGQVSNTAQAAEQTETAPSVLAEIEGPRPEDNRLCMVCHASLAKEDITLKHFEQGILCIDCHGRSTNHMEDEMLNTPPDIKYGRIEVKPFCRGCHEMHKHPLKVEEYIEENRGRDRPNGRAIYSESTCTDCHGIHIYSKTDEEDSEEEENEADWITLFNGTDLSGWKPVGTAKWTVERSCIVGVQGENMTGGDLIHEDTYKDFLLTATFKVDWPANTGIWFRYQSPEKAYQADILEHPKPEAYTGTIYCPGKLFLAINLNKELVDREGWNTLSVQVKGDHIQTWLNGTKVGDVHDDTTKSGSIGIQVHPGEHFKNMKVMVREIMVKPL